MIFKRSKGVGLSQAEPGVPEGCLHAVTRSAVHNYGISVGFSGGFSGEFIAVLTPEPLTRTNSLIVPPEDYVLAQSDFHMGWMLSLTTCMASDFPLISNIILRLGVMLTVYILEN